MGVVIDPRQYIIGAADVYYRALGGTGAWASIGATVDDIVFRVAQSRFNPSENFNGILEEIKGMDYVSKQSAEAEFQLPEFAGEKLKLPILGAVVTEGTATDTGAGWSTTLDGAVAADVTSIDVASAVGLTVGDLMHIDESALSEYRVIDEIASETISFRDPLRLDHATGVAVVQADDDGKTEITPGSTRRQPDTAYNDFVLVAQSPADYYELYLYNAISKTESAEITFGNESMAAVGVTVGTRRDGLNLALPSWRLRVPGS